MFKDRHARVEKDCENCGSKFFARVERVQNGQGRFCSLRCANEFQKRENSKSWGFENGKKYWDRKRWVVRWYDLTGKIHVVSYPNWWWTLNIGEVPDGYGISYKDSNSENIDPQNFYMIKLSEISRMNGSKAAGKPRLDIKGEKNKWWRGGSTYEGYPTEFSKPLKRRIKIRDNYTCQCCYCSFTTLALDVHHIDRNRKNNQENNLVTVCKGCHKAIHGKNSKLNDRIIYFQSLMVS